MSEAGMKVASASAAGLWEKLVMTVLLTVSVGPMVGTAMVFLAIATGDMVLIATFVRGGSVLFVLLLGYVAGGFQAALCGLTFALYGWRFGRLPMWLPIVIALPLASAFKFIVFGMLGEGLIESMLIHVVPALVAWWLVKAYWQRAEA
ncbi:hypothetical protein [Taklimakanibacter deserti]|uniref:hypothetical protein n=1 Tax=Taklimakanibacter deserti TaxID=2267839 RepID=UPI000E657ABC